ncbi:hypothetical protein S1OALGB6SA_610 [Olavius algarvensis spirochete endosymbiont]|uniref:mechanosensitive ion channel family protein n=1 Tax=Olavius algarvensis spirochete endosymbiont TaxID=260710 RepID=UPI00052D754E|nr:mechanosensitive ion channel domain-containing protein [Olavius algarvensis spirochete endosymbiont]KGM43447.1 hypothetical protein JY97_07275 [Alkalispirochaeta odontotermitis]VDA99541.1 hypothetical protein S1OALGB6SA_610 [Olavius algarvensis spirochete endosymbiont]
MNWLESELGLLPFSLKDFLLKFIIPVLSVLIAIVILRVLARRITRRVIKNQERQKRVRHNVLQVTRVLAGLGIVLSALNLLGGRTIVRIAFQFLNKPFFTSGNTEISVITLILAIPIFMLASWVGKITSSGVETRTLRRFGLDAERIFALSRLLRYSITVIIVIFGLSAIGIDLSAIGVFFGVLGIGIGFGLQSVIADLFAGITLILMALIKEGDRIHVGNYEGNISRIRLMNTELLTFENETLIIPNSQLTSGTIHNFSHKDLSVVIVNDVDVSYNSNLDQVIELLKDVASRNPWLRKDKEIIVRVYTFASSGITMKLRTWIGNVGDRAEARSWTNLEIWRTFVRNSIEIPFPQRDIHIKAESNEDGDNLPVV